MTRQDLTLAQTAQRYLAQFPDLHGLARQAAGHILQRQLGYWLDPDQLFWHEFASASSSASSYTGWRHSGPPQRSLTLTELVIQRFSSEQQSNADQLAVYGGFYRVDASHAEFDERNEVRLAPQTVQERLWGMDFAVRYSQLLTRFRTEHGSDFCVLARARFLAALAHCPLAEAERAELLAATFKRPAVPVTVAALKLDCDASVSSGWSALTLGGIAARALWQCTLSSGRRCLYLADERGGLQVYEDRHALQAGLSDLAHGSDDRLMGLFIGDDALSRTLQPRLRGYFKLLASSRGDIELAGQGITGDLFVHLREQAMAELVNNAHERLTRNAELRKADWLAGLSAANQLLGPMLPLGLPVVLTSLGVGAVSLGLHLDQAINGKSAWRSAAWSAVVLDMLFILLDAAMMRGSQLFGEARMPSRLAPANEALPGRLNWGLYMRPAADELLAYSDAALAGQERLMGAVPWADLERVGARGEYLDAFSEPYPVYRDEQGYGSAAIADYSSTPERYNNLWRGWPLDDERALCIQRSHELAHALAEVRAFSPVRLYRAVLNVRGTGTSVFRDAQVGVGDVLVTTDFTSFTENPFVLWEVFNQPQAVVKGAQVFDDSAVVFILEPGEEVQAVPVAPFSRRPDEAESLMLPGRYLRVDAVTRVKGANHRFMEVRLCALAQPPSGTVVHDMRTGAVFDRDALAQRLGADDSLMRRFFAAPS